MNQISRPVAEIGEDKRVSVNLEEGVRLLLSDELRARKERDDAHHGVRTLLFNRALFYGLEVEQKKLPEVAEGPVLEGLPTDLELVPPHGTFIAKDEDSRRFNALVRAMVRGGFPVSAGTFKVLMNRILRNGFLHMHKLRAAPVEAPKVRRRMVAA